LNFSLIAADFQVGYNALMNDQNFARLEAQLERLIEGAFAQLFGKTIRPQDIALQLSRAMEDNAVESEDPTLRALAPDHYDIIMNPQVHDHLLRRQPRLTQILSQHMVELATEAGFRLNSVPTIQILADAKLDAGQLVVRTSHSQRRSSTTAMMKPIELKQVAEHDGPRNPQLIINGQRTVPLHDPFVNIGRNRENHIILDDPYTSRHHCQLRLRFGRYTLFDGDSQGGTFVNDVRIREHVLQPGDVIRVGRTQLVYVEDDPMGDSQTGANTALDG
jgi:FHA domain-containing protein